MKKQPSDDRRAGEAALVRMSSAVENASYLFEDAADGVGVHRAASCGDFNGPVLKVASCGAGPAASCGGAPAASCGQEQEVSLAASCGSDGLNVRMVASCGPR